MQLGSLGGTLASYADVLGFVTQRTVAREARMEERSEKEKFP